MNTRFFVSTISSLQTNPEIFDLVNFDVLILDEASQVLETQIIGILSLVEKFILIGDEKQLPAIVLQEEEEDEQLKSKIHLKSFSESLFQRLLRVCETKNWNSATAILTHQGRMHEQIQQLSNFLVYNNKLIPFDNDWQKTKESKFLLNSNYSLKKLFENRVTFINSPIIQENKYHKWEAKLISKITSQIFKINPNNFTEKTVGVISPYRLQCRTIINVLSEEIRKLVTVDTVERFQGSEREIVIMSFATNFEYLLSTLTNEIVIDGELIDRKLNVAITRAKEHLILIGNETILSKSEIYRKAIGWIKENGTYLDLSNNL
jgi:DNA replication ATP-dependent helicase Dna2